METKYELNGAQIHKFGVVLLTFCKVDYVVGGMLTGCVRAKDPDTPIPCKAWKDFSEHPEYDVKAYVIVFMISRGYYPLNLESRMLCLSHPCGAPQSNCMNPRCIKLELTRLNGERWHCHVHLQNLRKFNNFVGKADQNKNLKCKKHTDCPCYLRVGKTNITKEMNFDLIGFIQRAIRKIPADYDAS